MIAQEVHVVEPPRGAPATEPTEVEFRSYNEQTDKGVVFAPWARQIRAEQPFGKMDPKEFERHKETVIASLVDRCKPVMAAPPGEKYQVYGWCCAERREDRNILYFVYIRGVFRRFGIGTALMKMVFPKLGIDRLYFTHKTAAVKHFMDRWNAVWDPYSAR